MRVFGIMWVLFIIRLIFGKKNFRKFGIRRNWLGREGSMIGV